MLKGKKTELSKDSEVSRLVETDEAIIRAELDRILSERQFAGAPQMSAFLRYIVTETLEGHADRIKAFSVGVDALGKPDTFDAQTDPSVRVLALRLRKTLSAYYESCPDCLAIIELKVGTYVPSFFKVGSCSSSSSGVSDQTNENSTKAFPERRAGTANRVERSVHNGQPEIVFPVDSLKDGYKATGKSADSAELVSVGVPLIAQAASTLRMRRLPGWQWFILLAVIFLAFTFQIVWSSYSSALKTSLGFDDVSSQKTHSGVVNARSTYQSVALHEIPPQPIIYLRSARSLPDVETRVLVIVSAAFVDSGLVDVVRLLDAALSRPQQHGNYLLDIQGFTVGAHAKVNAQILSLANGEVLYANSILLEDPEGMLTIQNLADIETIAADIVDYEGPVYQDFCSSIPEAESVSCNLG